MQINLELSKEEVYFLSEICKTLKQKLSVDLTIENYIKFLISEEIKAEINYSDLSAQIK